MFTLSSRWQTLSHSRGPPTLPDATLVCRQQMYQQPQGRWRTTPAPSPSFHQDRGKNTIEKSSVHKKEKMFFHQFGFSPAQKKQKKNYSSGDEEGCGAEVSMSARYLQDHVYDQQRATSTYLVKTEGCAVAMEKLSGLFKTMTEKCAVNRFVPNLVSDHSRSFICFRGLSFCVAAYGKNAFRARWVFWLQYFGALS